MRTTASPPVSPTRTSSPETTGASDPDDPSPVFAQVRGHYPPYPPVIHHGMVDERPGQSRKSTISIIAPPGCLHARGRYLFIGEVYCRRPIHIMIQYVVCISLLPTLV